MNGYTQNDLSFGEVKLDYQAILRSQRDGYNALKRELYRDYCSLNDADDAGDNVKRCSTVKRIHLLAEKIAVSGDTLSALVEGVDRPDKIFVNVPPVGEQKAPV